MRKLLLAALLVAVPSVAAAQIGYIEGSVGLALIPDVSTEDYAFDTGAGFFEGRGEFEFGTEFTGGVEAGFTTGRWRFGVGWDMASAQLDKGRIIGTLDGVPFSVEGTSAEIENYLGLSFDENVHVFNANAYYNFGAADVMVRPFVGLGLGGASFQNADTELAVSATAGVRFPLGTQAYVGGRYRFTWIQGPQDDLGIAYEDVTLHTISVILGFYFGGP